MKYNIVAVRPPSMRRFHPFNEREDLMRRIVGDRSVRVVVDKHSKQSLAISVSAGETLFSVTYVPKGCENLKFFTQTRRSVWSDKEYSASYFKTIKAQRWPEFKEYVKRVVDSLMVDQWAMRFGKQPFPSMTIEVEMGDEVCAALGAWWPEINKEEEVKNQTV